MIIYTNDPIPELGDLCSSFRFVTHEATRHAIVKVVISVVVHAVDACVDKTPVLETVLPLLVWSCSAIVAG